MKRFIASLSATFTLCLATLSFAPPEAYTHLVVWHKDGSKVVFSLTEKPKVSYVGENVIIDSSERIEYEFDAIKKMTYTDDISTAVDVQTLHTEKPFRSEGGAITFLAAENNLHVKIILTTGVVVKDFMVRKGDTSSVSFHSLPEKICLLNVNGVTYKIMVK